jgi:hypothetical protein
VWSRQILFLKNERLALLLLIFFYQFFLKKMILKKMKDRLEENGIVMGLIINLINFVLILLMIFGGFLIAISVIVGLYANLTCTDYIINYPWGHQWYVKNYCYAP